VSHKNPCECLPGLCLALLVLGCAPPTLIRPLPPGSGVPEKPPAPPAQESLPAAVTPEDTLDFAMAIIETDTAGTDFEAVMDSARLPAPETTAVEIRETPPAGGAARYPAFAVGTDKVRVLLRRNVKRTVVYSVGNVAVADGRTAAHRAIRGRIGIQTAGNGREIEISSGKLQIAAALPCTLRSVEEYNFIELEEKPFRGSMILVGDSEGFSTVNYLDVEEYLRGVVPLELGVRGKEEREALKAQAIAARTYTYKKIELKRKDPWDLASDISDQIYGGVSAESPSADPAVRLTSSLIMVHNGSIIYAYYHSTCGGRTARVDDVWNKTAQPYLVSVDDTDGSGKAWCAMSNAFTWEEKWPNAALVRLMRRYAAEPAVRGEIDGYIRSITVNSRFACGRVASCRFETASGAFVLGGDNIRQAMRRNTAGNPILKSSNFTVRSVGRDYVEISGKGYGHGVGMCQMGAVGRARAGQGFEQILKAYYRGVEIRTAWTVKQAR
jgi:stage II sporulation protein D